MRSKGLWELIEIENPIEFEQLKDENEIRFTFQYLEISLT
jgi:hypothetical protein